MTQQHVAMVEVTVCSRCIRSDQQEFANQQLCVRGYLLDWEAVFVTHLPGYSKTLLFGPSVFMLSRRMHS